MKLPQFFLIPSLLIANTLISCGIAYPPNPAKITQNSSSPLSRNVPPETQEIAANSHHNPAATPIPEQNAHRSPTQPIAKKIATSIPILMYHSISSTDPNNDLMVPVAAFEAQMKYLKAAGYHTISFKELEDWRQNKPIPIKPILLTFDDGYIDNYTAAYPILKKYNLKATFFVSTRYIGDSRHITWEQIQEMQESGLIEMGSHTQTHADLTVISAAQRQKELTESKKIIEEKTGNPVRSFAYPAGVYDETVIQEVAKAGYQFAVTTQPGEAKIQQGLLTLHRVRIHGYYGVADFAAMFPKGSQ